MHRPRPIPNCYWVDEGKLMAGEYPGAHSPEAARARIEAFLQAGLSYFLDLTEPYELRSYERVLLEEAVRVGIEARHVRKPIPDMSVPGEAHMASILNTIDEAIDSGHSVYVHCLGGIGRTGTVIGCYLTRHGLDAKQSLARIAELWRTTDKSAWFPHSPQTEEQFEMVRNWVERCER